MTIDTGKYSKFLEKVAEEIDIPPSKYQDAVDRYEAVGCWLEEGQYSGELWHPKNIPAGFISLGYGRKTD